MACLLKQISIGLAMVEVKLHYKKQCSLSFMTPNPYAINTGLERAKHMNHFVHAPGQWEMALHWLGLYTKIDESTETPTS